VSPNTTPKTSTPTLKTGFKLPIRIILERRNQPVAVLISLRDYQERFAEKAAADARQPRV